LVALLYPVLLFSCSNKHTKSTTSKNIRNNGAADSLQLKRYVNTAKLNYADWNGDSLDIVNWDVVDSLLNEGRINCCDGKIFYAPDSLFKIYVIEGEGCGAYCNPFWESYACSADNRKLSASQEFSFTNILNIHKLPDDKYLILQQEWGRAASVLSVDCRMATLVSLRNDSLIFHHVLKDIEDENLMKDFYYGITGLSFCQEHYIPSGELSVQYNARTNELAYNFGRNYAYCCQLETDSLISGSLKYEDGAFKFLKHSTKFIESAN
jgi:hypothetical protein